MRGARLALLVAGLVLLNAQLALAAPVVMSTIAGSAAGTSTPVGSLWLGESYRFGSESVLVDGLKGSIGSNWSGQPGALWSSSWPFDPEPSTIATGLSSPAKPVLAFEYGQNLSFACSNPVDGEGGIDIWGSYGYSSMDDAGSVPGDANAGLYLGAGDSKTVPTVTGSGGVVVTQATPTAGRYSTLGHALMGAVCIAVPRSAPLTGWAVYTYLGYAQEAARSGLVVYKLPVYIAADDEALRERVGDVVFQQPAGFLAWLNSGSKQAYEYKSQLVRFSGSTALSVSEAERVMETIDSKTDWGDTFPRSYDASDTAGTPKPPVSLPSGVQTFLDDIVLWLSEQFSAIVGSLLWPLEWAGGALS